MKLKINKKKIYMASYVTLVGGLALAGVICFSYAQYNKAKHTSSQVVLTGAQSKIKLLEAQEQDEATLDELAWYQDIADYFTVVNNDNANAYKKAALPAYLLTTASLVAFGLCLKHADIVKAKEEKDD